MSNEIVMRESEALATSYGYDMIPVEQIKNQIDQVKSLMASCMDDGVHYGKIPGCGDKHTLMQPGAQLLDLMFGMADTYEEAERELPNGHREYMVKCTLVSKSTGLVQGSGMGLCSTMESKYRYRNVADYEVTGDTIPADAKERKKEYRQQGYGMKKVDGSWEWVRYKDSGKQENPDIADTYNTVLKMACKRAHVAAALNTYGVSSLFTQDIEDLGSYAVTDTPTPSQAPAPDPRKALWKEVGSLKTQAIAVGISETDITDWMDAFIVNQDGTPKKLSEFTAEEITEVKHHIADLIANQETTDIYNQSELLPEDVDF